MPDPIDTTTYNTHVTMDEEKKIFQKLATLEDEHRALDEMISSSEKTVNQIYVQRLKKRKLWLRDEIARLHAMLYPDTIA